MWKEVTTRKFLVKQNPSSGIFPRHIAKKLTSSGLLANLWDFPHVISEPGEVSSSYVDRKEAINSFLKKLLTSDELKAMTETRKDLGTALHLFSHIRRTMYVELIELKPDIGENIATLVDAAKEDRFQIVSEEEMLNSLGVPTTLKKAHGLIDKKRVVDSKDKNGKKAKVEKGQTSISSFFKKKE